MGFRASFVQGFRYFNSAYNSPQRLTTNYFTGGTIQTADPGLDRCPHGTLQLNLGGALLGL